MDRFGETIYDVNKADRLVSESCILLFEFQFHFASDRILEKKINGISFE